MGFFYTSFSFITSLTNIKQISPSHRGAQLLPTYLSEPEVSGMVAFIAPSASSGTFFIERRMLIRWWVGNEKLKRSIATD